MSDIIFNPSVKNDFPGSREKSDKMTTTGILPKIEFPENMTEGEEELVTGLAQCILNSVPPDLLGAFTAEEIFGDKMNSTEENLFLKSTLDESKPFQGELAARVSAMLEPEPELLCIQVLGRKAGYHMKDEKFKYCCAISLGEKQIISTGREEIILGPGSLSPIYEMAGRNKPFIPYNRTIIKFPNGRSTLKNKEYKSILVWAFWNEQPKKILLE